MFKIPLIKPYLTEELKKSVCEVLDSRIWTEGVVTRQFEESIREFTGCRHAIAVSNCTVGLEVALRVLGIGPGDEVIVPDYTYPATASVVHIVGATSVLVDVDPKTLLMDFNSLESAITKRTKAVIPVSLFGNPLDYERLNQLKEKHGFWIVEDAACSIGAEYRGIKVGNLADLSVFSFHPRKFISTGEGGCITTNREEWARWIDSYKHFGMAAKGERESVVFERIGTNYKLSNIQAAIGLYQMKHIDELLKRRRELAARYEMLLKDVPQITFPDVIEGGTASYQSFCVLVKGRDRIMRGLRDQGIEAQIGTYALHRESAYRDHPQCVVSGKMPGSKAAYENCLTLPLYHDLTVAEQNSACELLIDLLKI